MSVLGKSAEHLLWIGLAGATGAMARTAIGQVIHSESGFPVATLAVNLIGAFLLCLLVAGVFRKVSTSTVLQSAVTTGFLGSFTTFSALSLETVQLMEDERFVVAILYVGVSIIGGILAGTFGFHLGGKQVST